MPIILKYYRVDNARQSISSIETIDIKWIENLVTNPIIATELSTKENTPMIYWGTRINDSSMWLAANYGTRCAIILDYDKNVQIEEFISEFGNKFRYYLHTSWSHSKELHKFRVIIPVKEPFDKTDEFVRGVKSMFNGVDTCTSDCRGFYAPINRGEYRYHISTGPVLTMPEILGDHMKEPVVDEFDRMWDEAQNQNTFIRTVEYSEEAAEAYKNKVMESMESDLNSVSRQESGDRYTELRRIQWKMFQKRNPTTREFVFEEEEIRRLILSHTDDQRIRKLLKSSARKRK